MATILKYIKCAALLLLGYTCLGSGASTLASIVDETSSLRSHQCKVAEDDIDINGIDQTCPTTVMEHSIPTAKQLKRKKLEVVTFTAQEEVKSAVLPLPPARHASSTSNQTHRSLHKFFTATENIDLQFADRAEVHYITNPSQDLMDTFHRLNEQRRLEAGLTPTPTHADYPAQLRIVGLTNPPMHCLGLILHSVTHVGIQTFVDGECPEVHLTLMETEFQATGPQFLVNLFNKIMLHEDNNTGGKQKAVETIGFTREFMCSILLMLHNTSSFICKSDIVSFSNLCAGIWAEPAKNDDDHEDGIIFVDQARLEARIYVPPLLIRLFPISKRRMEKAGSATLLKTIRNDMIPAMDRLVGAYRLWIGGQDENVLCNTQ